jgi:hypothetical protein
MGASELGSRALDSWSVALLLALQLIGPANALGARLEISLVPFGGGLEADVSADFDVAKAAFGVIFAQPCSSCAWQKDPSLSPFTRTFGTPWMTEEGENMFAVDASAWAATAFPAPRELNPSSPRSFRLGRIHFNGSDPGLLRTVRPGDPAFDDLDRLVGGVGGDAVALFPAEGIIDFTDPENVYSLTVIPEPASWILLGSGAVGLASLRRLRQRQRA